MRRVIRLGDPTSHGGKVVSATSHVTVGGIPVARVGDRCTCPIKGHNNCVITEGDPNWLIDGIPVALEGCGISCGGVVLSTAPNAGRVYEGGTNGNDGGVNGAGPLSAGFNLGSQGETPKANPEDAIKDANDEQVRIFDQDGNPMPNVPYHITDESGNTYRGLSDAQGCCERIYTDGVQTLSILIGVTALEKW